jgi:hypothetical protein
VSIAEKFSVSANAATGPSMMVTAAAARRVFADLMSASFRVSPRRRRDYSGQFAVSGEKGCHHAALKTLC